MMSSLQFDSASIQNILIALVVICAVVYGYIELRKMHAKINSLETKVKKMMSLGPPVMRPPDNQSLSEVSAPKPELSPEKPQPGTEISQQNDIEEISIDIESGNPIEELEEIPNEIEIIQDTNEKEVTTDAADIVDIQKNLIDELSNSSMMNGLFIAVETTGSGIVEDIVEGPVQEKSTLSIEELPVEELPVEEPLVEEVKEDNEEIVMDKLEQLRGGEDDVIIPKNTDDISFTGDISFKASDPVAEGGYEEYTIRELKDILTDMDLPTSGNKSKLIQRIVSNKK